METLWQRRKCLPESHARRRLVEMQRIDRRHPRVRLVQHEHARMRRLVLRLDRPASCHVRLPDEQNAMELLLRQQRRILRGSDVREKEGTQENGARIIRRVPRESRKHFAHQTRFELAFSQAA